jgi:hypothetical protein
MDRKPPNASKPDRQAIIRAVASSTAIETGKSVRQLETVLRDGPTGKLSARLRTLVLAK